MHVNQTWLKRTPFQVWRSEFSVSEEIENLTDRDLLAIVRKIHNGPSRPITVTKPEDHLYQMYSAWYGSKWEKEEDYVKIWLSQILQATTRQDLARVLGQLMRYRISTFVSMEVQEETQPPYKVRASFVPGNLALPASMYLNEEFKEHIAWKHYESLVQTMAVEYGLPFLLDAMEGEKVLAEILKNGNSGEFKSLKGRHLERLAPDMPWDVFMDAWGADPEWKQRTLLLDGQERLGKLLAWFTHAPVSQVAGVLALHLLVFASPYLRPVIRQKSIALFQTALRGVSKEPSRELQFLMDLKQVLPDMLCYVYSRSRHDTEIIKDVAAMSDEIRKAAIDIMRGTRVFSKRTRSHVFEKLARMRFRIGKGGESSPLTVTYDPESLVHSCFSVFEARTAQMLATVGRPSFPGDQGSYPCFAANASYFSESNHIVMPWGILQWPFYCKAAELGWNYGGLGAILAHELTHAFDMEGRFYNQHAVYKQWWTRKNREKFEAKTRRVKQVFSKVQHFGIALDGERTLSENWADLGGLTVSLKALKSHFPAGISRDAEMEAYRNFFISYAVSWRTLVRKQKMIYSILTSVHSPNIDRVDHMVPNFQEWVDAFDVKPGDALYKHPRDRIKFF